MFIYNICSLDMYGLENCALFISRHEFGDKYLGYDWALEVGMDK